MSRNTMKNPPAADAAAPAPAMSPAARADFDRHLAAARKIPRGEVLPMRADLQLALFNAALGAKSIAAATAAQRKELPAVDFAAIGELPQLGFSLLVAHGRIEHKAEAAVTPELLGRARVLRHLLLTTLGALATAELLKPAEVEKFHAAPKTFDLAAQLVALPEVFAKNAAAIQGKHAVSQAQLDEATALGEQLSKSLTPSRAKNAVRAAGSAEASLDRDRLWTLLVQRHEQAWRAGAYLFGPAEIDARVPSLFAHKGGRPAKKPAPAPTPAPAK